MTRITKEELLEKLFHDDYEHLKGKRLRMTRVRVPGKEVCLAHILSPSQSCIYQNLALHIGVHEGEDHTGESIGMIRFTPWEAVVVAADVAVKSANVEIGFMDRFCGSLILTGRLSDVQTAVEEVVTFLKRSWASIPARFTEADRLFRSNPDSCPRRKDVISYEKIIPDGKKRSRKDFSDSGAERRRASLCEDPVHEYGG